MRGRVDMGVYGSFRLAANPDWRAQRTLDSSGNQQMQALVWAMPLLYAGHNLRRPDMLARFYSLLRDWWRDHPYTRPRGAAVDHPLFAGQRTQVLLCAAQVSRARDIRQMASWEAARLVASFRLGGGTEQHRRDRPDSGARRRLPHRRPTAQAPGQVQPRPARGLPGARRRIRPRGLTGIRPVHPPAARRRGRGGPRVRPRRDDDDRTPAASRDVPGPHHQAGLRPRDPRGHASDGTADAPVPARVAGTIRGQPGSRRCPARRHVHDLAGRIRPGPQPLDGRRGSRADVLLGAHRPRPGTHRAHPRRHRGGHGVQPRGRLARRPGAVPVRHLGPAHLRPVARGPQQPHRDPAPAAAGRRTLDPAQGPSGVGAAAGGAGRAPPTRPACATPPGRPWP